MPRKDRTLSFKRMFLTDEGEQRMNTRSFGLRCVQLLGNYLKRVFGVESYFKNIFCILRKRSYTHGLTKTIFGSLLRQHDLEAYTLTFHQWKYYHLYKKSNYICILSGYCGGKTKLLAVPFLFSTSGNESQS